MYKLLIEDNLPYFIDDLMATEFIALDTETDSIDTITCRLLLFQVRINKEIWIFHALEEGQEFFIKIIELINSSGKTIIAHNAKFDIKVIYQHSNILLGNIYDTMVVESITSNGYSRKWSSYAELAEKYAYVLVDKDSRKEFFSENFDGIITNEMLNYACVDVLYLEDIMKEQLKQIEALKLNRVLTLEMDLIPVVAKMELNGVLLDSDKWKILDIECKNKSIECRNKIIDFFIDKLKIGKEESALVLATKLGIRDSIKLKKDREQLELLTDEFSIIEFFKKNINLNSHAQMLKMLNLSGVKVTSTNEKVLIKYRNRYEIMDTLLTYREQEKKISTYGLNFLDNINKRTGRIHSDFNQMGTFSGRFSSAHPNLQNIPIKDNKMYRECFIARKGYKILAVDYSQQEYRIAGDISGDKVIIDAYNKGLDIHTITAGLMYDLDPKEVSKSQRNSAKTMNYAILYGTSDYGLAKTFGIIEDEARALKNKVISGYPRLFTHKELVEKYVVNNKMSRTLLGRIRFFENVKIYYSGDDFAKEIGKMSREGYNHMIQGTAADMSKLAMIYMHYNNPFGEDFRLIMPVHDEFVIEAKEEIVDEAFAFISEQMIKAGEFFIKKIPTVVEGTKGDYWTK